MSHCRSCDAPIRFVKTLAGKSIPLDAEPSPSGNVTLEEVDGHTVALVHHAGADAILGERYTSHFATCPQGDFWRQRKGR